MISPPLTPPGSHILFQGVCSNFVCLGRHRRDSMERRGVDDGLVAALSVRPTYCGLRASWLRMYADREHPQWHFLMQSDERARKGSRRWGRGRMIRVVNWNIAKRWEPWRELAQMARQGKVDVALLQEAGNPPGELVNAIELEDDVLWSRHLYDRWPLVVRLSDRVEVEGFRQVPPISELGEGDIGVSGIGTMAVAKVTPVGRPEEAFVAASMYARWMKRLCCKLAEGAKCDQGLPVHVMILRWPDGPVATPWPRSGRTVRDRRRARRSGPRRQCRPGGRTSRPGPCAARASTRSP